MSNFTKLAMQNRDAEAMRKKRRKAEIEESLLESGGGSSSSSSNSANDTSSSCPSYTNGGLGSGSLMSTVGNAVVNTAVNYAVAYAQDKIWDVGKKAIGKVARKVGIDKIIKSATGKIKEKICKEVVEKLGGKLGKKIALKLGRDLGIASTGIGAPIAFIMGVYDVVDIGVLAVTGKDIGEHLGITPFVEDKLNDFMEKDAEVRMKEHEQFMMQTNFWKNVWDERKKKKEMKEAEKAKKKAEEKLKQEEEEKALNQNEHEDDGENEDNENEKDDAFDGESSGDSATKKGLKKSVTHTLGTFGGTMAISFSTVGVYRLHYTGEFEYKGITGEYQNANYTFQNFTEYDKNGDVVLTGLTKENKLLKTFYTKYSDKSYYVIVEDSKKYGSNIDEAYLRKNLLTPDELREQYPEIEDVNNREVMFQLNPDVLYVLDKYIHEDKVLYPQQFVKPLFYEESQKDFGLKDLIDSSGSIVAKSQVFDDDGKPLKNSDGSFKTTAGIWDYGFASILRYKEYEVPVRKITTPIKREMRDIITGEIVSTEDIPGATVKTEDIGNREKPAYIIDMAVTAGGTVKNEIKQEWQRNEESLKTDKKISYTTVQTGEKEVCTPMIGIPDISKPTEGKNASKSIEDKEESSLTELEKDKDTSKPTESVEDDTTSDSNEDKNQSCVTVPTYTTYEVLDTYEIYTEEKLPQYEGEPSSEGLTGSKYFRDYMSVYSNYYPDDLPRKLDFDVLNNEEIQSLIYDDDPNALVGGTITSSSTVTKEEFEKAVFMGDSITVGLKASSTVPENRVYAEGGYTVTRGSSEFSDAIIAAKPPVIVISYGTNDAGYENVEGFKKDYKVLITKFKESIPGVKIYINKIFPGNESLAKADREKKIIKNIPSYNAALSAIALETGVTLIDCTNIANLNTYYQDAFHFKSSFYSVWMSEMEKKIVSASPNITVSGKSFKAEFTAYKSGDGGYHVDASGNKLDYTKNTCAGPVKSLYPKSELTLGSKVIIQGTGTDKDGMTCTITDTGVPLDSDGTYHIDILVKDEATARKFGRRKGTITLVDSGTSNSRSSVVSSSTTNFSITSPNTRTGISNKVGDKPLNEVLEIGKQKDSKPVQATLQYLEIAEKYGKMYGIDPYIICAIITAESKGKANIEGINGYSYDFTNGSPVKSNAYYGLMQIKGEYAGNTYSIYNHSTGKMDNVVLDKNRIVDPDHNIQIGTIMLAQNFKYSNYNVYLSIQGHNFGINGAKFVQLYYLSNGTLESIPYTNTPNAEQEAQFKEYSITNDTGWLTALFKGDLEEEKAQNNGHGFYDPNDGVHDACTWYGSKRNGQPYYLRETMQYYAGDGSPWMMKEDGTVVTADGGNASGMSNNSSNGTPVTMFNQYLKSNWSAIMEKWDDLFPGQSELDKKLDIVKKGDYTQLYENYEAKAKNGVRSTSATIPRSVNKDVATMNNVDKQLALNMMFALNQGNYLFKYDNMTEAEWKAMYTQLLSSPTGQSWDDGWIGFTVEDIFGIKKIEDLGTLFPTDIGITPTISVPYGITDNVMNFGINIVVPPGTDVLTVADGTVISISKKNDFNSKYGNYVKIQHAKGTVTITANLKTVKVKVGDKLKLGDVIGTSGGDCKSYKDNAVFYQMIHNGDLINPTWVITREMTGYEDPIQGNNGVVCENTTVSNTTSIPYVETALKQTDKPYVSGGEGPNGFDCSGLVYWSMKQHGIDIPRDSRSQRKATQRISYENLQRGDLIFRHGPYEDKEGKPDDDNAVEHVMIYLGDNKILHASSPSRGILVEEFKKTNSHTYGRYSAALGTQSSTSSGCQTPDSVASNNGYLWPAPTGGRISAPFGEWRDNGTRQHKGIDIAGKIGGGHPDDYKIPIIASVGGEVVGINTSCPTDGKYGNKCGGGWGNYVKIKDSQGNYWIYAHMTKGSITVSKGQMVAQGQEVGKMGNSGSSTGVHLHFEVRIGKDSENNAVDPLKFVTKPY